MNRTTFSPAVLLLCVATSAHAVPKPPRIFGIANVQIEVKDLAAARNFYSRVVPSTGPCTWCEEFPRILITLPVTDMQFLDLSRTPSPTPLNLLTKVSFWTDDIKGLKLVLASNHIAFRISGKRSDATIELADPEGNTIEFMQPRPVSSLSTLNTSSFRLIHAGFIIHNLAATEHFYKDILGFRPYWHGGLKDDQTDWVSLQVPDGTDWLEFMVNVEPDADQRLRGVMNHIGIGVTDIHATHKRLMEAGAEFTEEPQIGRDGKWQLNLYDPDGTRIELMEFTPVQPPCCSPYTGPHPKP